MKITYHRKHLNNTQEPVVERDDHPRLHMKSVPITGRTKRDVFHSMRKLVARCLDEGHKLAETMNPKPSTLKVHIMRRDFGHYPEGQDGWWQLPVAIAVIPE